MSTSVSGPAPVKKISSWVRPGVLEVRANALRLVSALIRLDLPTLERPAKAISTPSGGGSDSSEEAADRKRHSAANRFRDVSLSSELNASADIGLVFFQALAVPACFMDVVSLRRALCDCRTARSWRRASS